MIISLELVFTVKLNQPNNDSKINYVKGFSNFH